MHAHYTYFLDIYYNHIHPRARTYRSIFLAYLAVQIPKSNGQNNNKNNQIISSEESKFEIWNRLRETEQERANKSNTIHTSSFKLNSLWSIYSMVHVVFFCFFHLFILCKQTKQTNKTQTIHPTHHEHTSYKQWETRNGPISNKLQYNSIRQRKENHRLLILCLFSK